MKPIILVGQSQRDHAKRMIDASKPMSVVSIKDPTRSTEQNSRLWAMLSDVQSQKTWHGVKLASEDWKLIFMDSLNREMRIVPNMDGDGFVNLGRSSSKLTVAEMSDLMEVISAWGAHNGVIWSEKGKE